jgi:fatty-acyl-CoA synthase
MLYWNAINTFLRLDINSADRAINCAPPFHTGGWNVLQTPFILHGAYTLLMRNFNADEVLKILSHDKHTIFWAVPTMLKMMRQSANYESANFSNIRYFIVGGEAMPIPEIQEWNKKGVAIRQGYGLTEVGPNVTSLNQEDAIRKQGSIGFPNFYYDIKITDEKGHEVKAGESGELWLKGPTVTTGYWNNLEATLDTITDGWFHTGDVVRMDEEGFLYIVDRIKNMYISGGENVYPADVEHTLRQHPSIEQVAIIGVPDEKWGESGKAFIKRKNNISKEEILDFCRQKLAKYKIPKHIEFIEQLPLNDSGKIDRKKLKENQQ